MNPMARQTVTTKLVHRRDRTNAPWWRSVTICDLPGAFDDADLERIQRQLNSVAKIGFGAVLLRPVSSHVETDLTYLPDFIATAHERGLRVIVRAFIPDDDEDLQATDSPPLLSLEHDVEVLKHNVKSILDAGADGVDLGPIDESPDSPDSAAAARAFTEAVQAQLAEVAIAGDTTMLSAAVKHMPREQLMRHLTEEWFHHLRTDAMVTAEWDSAELQERVRETYAALDPLGHTAAWRYSLPRWSDSPLARSSSDYGWADSEHATLREEAMMLYILSLPGSVYVPYVAAGGRVRASKGKNPHLKFNFAKSVREQLRAWLASEALTIREQYKLGDENLAFVDGLAWARKGVSVHLSGSIMVVVNTGKKAVLVPPEHKLALSSEGLSTATSGGTEVRPNTCSWFYSAPVVPVDPIKYR